MGKIERQIAFITRLREFTGRVPAVFIDQKEFFINSLRDMSEDLIDLKREALRETCANFTAKLDAGTVAAGTTVEFKDLLERLVSARDFSMVCASMTGSKELLKQRIAGLTPFSLIEEEKKAADRDPEANRRIGEAYSRLNFAALIKEFSASPDGRSAETALAKARAEVAEYCCLYHIPLDKSDTFTPFSLSCVDAAIAASWRFLSDIRKNADLKNPGGKLILIVDDDTSVLDMLAFLVGKEGFKVETAADGEEALKKAKKLHPDLVLLDLMLPKVSGFEILRELQDDATADIPIVIITGRCSDRTTTEMIKREPNIKDLMEKPVKPHVLAALIRTLMKAAATDRGRC